MAVKHPRERPARPMPSKIDASSEEIAGVAFQVPYKEIAAALEQEGERQGISR